MKITLMLRSQYSNVKEELTATGLTLLPADDRDRWAELQPGISISIKGPGSTLHTRSCLEVDGVQCDGLGIGEEGVGIDLTHGTCDSIWPSGGTNEPAVLSQGVVNVLHSTDRTSLVKVRVFGVACLKKIYTDTNSREHWKKLDTWLLQEYRLSENLYSGY